MYYIKKNKNIKVKENKIQRAGDQQTAKVHKPVETLDRALCLWIPRMHLAL